MERPYDAIRYADAAHILGVTPSTVRRHVLARRLMPAHYPSAQPSGRLGRQERMLSRAEAERLALQTYRHRKHVSDPDFYWVTGKRAADILGVNVARLNQLAAKGFLPFEVHADGTRMYRRRQLEVVANAREARWRQ